MQSEAKIRMDWKLFTLFTLTLPTCCHALPTVDKGVFVIVGVQTCGNGTGYCILGNECSVDKEFVADNHSGHCDGLKTAFTPRANFLCCMLAEPEVTTTVRTTTSTTEPTPSVESVESVSVESPELVEEHPPTTLKIPQTSPATTTTIYEQKTEISVEQSLSLEVLCGISYGGTGEGRVASQNPTTSSCFTAAIVRSPTSLFSLSDPGSFLCTGAMITKDFLLTSATCVSRLFQQDLSLFKVIPGARHIVHPSHGLSAAEYRNIQEIHVHKDYSVNGHLRYNDIAMVKLEPSNGTGSYCSICLPDPNEDWSNGNCFVTGYSHPADSNDSDGFLHEAPQHIEPAEVCNRTVNPSLHRDLSGLICGSGEKSQEACFSPRDAGSPLSCNAKGVMKLAGVFSSGFHCGSQSSPVLYTDVRKYLTWVKNLL